MNARRAVSTFLLATSLLALAAWPRAAAAQMTADAVLRNIAEEYAARFGGVETMIVTSRMEGDMAAFDRMTTYLEKTTRNGQPAFRTHVETEGGLVGSMARGGSSRMSQGDLLSAMRLMPETLAGQAAYRGTASLGSETVHVLFVEDMTPLYRALAEESGHGNEATPSAKNASLYVAADGWVLRKMDMEMEVSQDGKPHTVQMTMAFDDYRDVQGLLYPYRTTVTMENALPEEQRAETKAQLEQLRSQLEQLPPAQRKQIEKMMQASQGLFGEKMEMVMAVEDVQVNEALPAGLFE